MADRTVSYRFTGDFSGLTAGLRTAGANVSEFGTKLTALDKNGAKMRAGLTQVGAAAGAAGLALAAGLGFAAKAAMDWESAFAGVEKTVDGTASQMAALEGELRGLAKTMPVTHKEIAATAEAAGQLGVAREDVAEFTKVMLQLGATTDVTADQAATSIQQLMNVLGSAPEVVDEIGNTLVDLGNKGASTESQILNMAQRIAGAGKLIGASEQDVLGMAAAMANLGIQAEVGGSSAQRVLLNMYNALADGAEGATGFAEVAGVSAQTFAAAWESSPMQALDLFVKGLGELRAEGGNVVGVLNDLGIKGVQNQRVVLALAGAGNMLTKSLNQSGEAWEQNDALLIEYQKRAATTASQVQVAWNNVKDAGIDAGESILPVVANAAKGLAKLANAYQAIPGPAKGAINGVAGMAAVLGLGIWGASKAVNTIADVRQGLSALPISADKSSKALKGLGAAAAGLVALGAAAGAIRAIQQATDETLPSVDSLALRILELKDGQVSSLGSEFDSLGESIRRMADKSSLESFTDTMQTPFKALFGEAGSLRQARSEIDALDAALASLVASGSPEIAADALHSIADSANLSKSEFSALAGLLPQYSGAVDGAAASEKLAADSAKTHSDAVAGLASALEATTLDAKTLKDALDDLLGPQMGLSAATDAWTTALRHLSDDLDKNERSLRGNSDAAIKNRSAVRDRVSSMTDLLVAEAEAGASSERLSGMLRRQRAALIEAGEAAGISKKEMRGYLDTLGLTPDLIKTLVRVDGADEAASKVRALNAELSRVVSKTITVTANVVKNGLKSMEWDTGGYTGPGHRLQPAGIVHAGEVVLPQDVVRRDKSHLMSRYGYLPGMAGLSGLPGYADGGRVGGRSLDSRIEIVGLLQTIRDLRRDLNRGGKDALHGLKRRAAELDLKRAQIDLRRARHAEEREARETRRSVRDLTRGFDLGDGFGPSFPTSLSAQYASETRGVFAEFRRGVKEAGGDLPKNFKTLRDRAVDLSKKIGTATERYEKASEALADLRQSAKDFAAGVGNIFNNDIFAKGGLANAMLQLEADRNDTQERNSLLQAVAALGLDTTSEAFKALALGGDLQTLRDLNNVAGVKAYAAMFADRQAQQQAAGQWASQAAFGAAIAKQEAIVEKQATAINALTAKLEGLEDRLAAKTMTATMQGTQAGAYAGTYNGTRDARSNQQKKQASKGRGR